MKIITYAFGLLFPMTLVAQIQGQGNLMGSDATSINMGSKMSMINGVPVETGKDLYAGVKGSAFIFKDFVKGYVVTKDTFNSHENYTYNFDAYKQELHVRYPNGMVKILFNEELRGFQLLDEPKRMARNFKKLRIQTKLPQYYEILGETAQYSLVKLWGRQFVKANPVDRGVHQTGLYDEFMEYEKFFLKVAEGHYLELDKLTKKSFIKLLPKQEQQIETIWKKFKWGRKINEMEISQLLKALEGSSSK